METLNRIPFQPMKAIFERLAKVTNVESLTPDERYAYERDLKAYRDYKAQMDYAKEEGIETIVKTVSDKTVINDTLEAFKGEIDVLYVPTDNNIASAMGSVAIFAKENKLPVVCGESNAAKSGGLASLGVDYYTIGYQSGEMAVSILKGEKTINELPIETQKEFSVYYNLNTADEIGFEIPQSIIAKGIDISE